MDETKIKSLGKTGICRKRNIEGGKTTLKIGVQLAAPTDPEGQEEDKYPGQGDKVYPFPSSFFPPRKLEPTDLL
jgi:hypothetical protein